MREYFSYFIINKEIKYNERGIEERAKIDDASACLFWHGIQAAGGQRRESNWCCVQQRCAVGCSGLQLWQIQQKNEDMFSTENIYKKLFIKELGRLKNCNSKHKIL